MWPNGNCRYTISGHNIKISLHQLDVMYLDEIWFQQDDATCHTTRKTDKLSQYFLGRAISKTADLNWPPKSRHLTPCDLFLQGFVNYKIFTIKPQKNTKPQTEIHQVIFEIGINHFEKHFQKFY